MSPQGTPSPTSIAAQNGIRIRYFRRTDAPQVRELFMLAMAHGPGSPRRVALSESLFHPTSYFTYALITTGLATFALAPNYRDRFMGAALSVGVALGFWRLRYLVSDSFLDYCRNSLEEDLKDVAMHYGMQPTDDSSSEGEGEGEGEGFAPSGPSAFWVVECDSRDGDGRGAEIVGCIGLDCQNKDGVLRAELRRLVVSPSHRRMGIAALLVRTLIAHAKEHSVPTVWLATTEFQRPAIDMYRKHGWVEARKEVVRERFGLFKFSIFHFRLDLIPS